MTKYFNVLAEKKMIFCLLPPPPLPPALVRMTRLPTSPDPLYPDSSSPIPPPPLLPPPSPCPIQLWSLG